MADKKKQQKKQVKKVVKKTAKAIKKSKHPGLIILVIILVIALAVAGYFVYTKYISTNNNENGNNNSSTNEDNKTPQSTLCDDLQIHILQLDNYYAGDCIYIKAGDVDILVDAGSTQNSAEYIENYIDQYVTDKKLEYVIATHADKDHIAAFVGPKKDGKYETGIFGYYECGLIIDFPQTTKTTEVYNNYCTLRDQEVANGATRYTALQCYNETDGAKRKYQLTDTIELEILYNYYYDHETSNENNFSVCFMINQGDKHFLFTGDLENEGKAEEYLVQYNSLPEVDFMKAGHHGSQTSSSVALLSQVKPKIMAISCCAGSTEYTKTAENTFPAQSSISRIATVEGIKVYCTREIIDNTEHTWQPMNGTIVVTSDGLEVKVNCSNNNTELKDTEWFKNNREWK